MPVTETAPTFLVARNVRVELTRSDKKQASLAAALGMSAASVSDRLTGKTPIDINELTAIARFLTVPLATLLAGVELEAAS